LKKHYTWQAPCTYSLHERASIKKRRIFFHASNLYAHYFTSCRQAADIASSFCRGKENTHASWMQAGRRYEQGKASAKRDRFYAGMA
jgi:hypothetical protein